MVSGSWRSSYNNGGTPGRSNSSVITEGIYINEFLAGNDSINNDEYGEYDDWIEFYNSTDKPVNMGGLYVTDNLNNPFKHQIPLYSPELTTVPAKGFILFWADGQPDQGVLHLSFKLAAEGEQIGLVQNSEKKAIFIDSLTYKGQQTNVSYGRYPDGLIHLFAFNVPTPLQRNVSTDIRDSEYLKENITLYQNYPNPFTLRTVISYHLPEFSDIEMNVYSITGHKVTTLVKERQPPGRYEVEWYAEGLKPGLYLYELKAGQTRKIMKMILLK